MPNEKLRREGDSEYKGNAKPVVCRGLGRSDTGGRRPHVYCLGAHLHLFTALYTFQYCSVSQYIGIVKNTERIQYKIKLVYVFIYE